MANADREEEFEVLYWAHVRRVMAYVLTPTSRANAPDVLSSAFLVAWRRFDKVPPDAFPWLVRVARRVLADQARSTSRRSACTDSASC
jgi:RNA polymerase sigma-70 factor (ECF subfamily)